MAKRQIPVENLPYTQLTDRQNQTGVQAISTISGLQTILDATTNNVATNTANIVINTTAILARLTLIVSANFSTIPVQSGANYKLILVLADESNGGIPTLYFYDGTGLQWLPTSKIY